MKAPMPGVIRLTVGPLGVECYLAYCPETREAAVIDPGGDASLILERIRRERLAVSRILLTHGHGDHIGALREVKASTGAPVLVHAGDAAALTDPAVNLSGLFGKPVTADPPDELLEEGREIPVGSECLTVLHTPGHTPGGVSFAGRGLVFTGDALFREGIGRTDLPGASSRQLLASIRTKLFTLSDECVVYPGHGPPTTIGYEKRHNRFLVGI